MLLSYASPSWAGGTQHEGEWNPRATKVVPGTAIPDLAHTGQRHFLSGVQGLGPQVRHSESSLLTFLGPRVAPIPPFLLLSPPQAQLGASSVGGDLGVTLGLLWLLPLLNLVIPFCLPFGSEPKKPFGVLWGETPQFREIPRREGLHRLVLN